ncbi:MAG: BrnT family toxin, partial [Gemmatimonadota bacterium]|nr:BrnT family toxin [Gemmatimonadota bacterium]
MRYEWDPDKAEMNAAKHGVRFSDAVSVFADDRA